MSSLDRLNEMEKKINEIGQLFYMIKDRIVALDYAVVSQAEAMAAMSETLRESIPNFNSSVMAKVRAAGDAKDADRVASMVEAKMIAPAETVSDTSLVVLKYVKSGETLMSNFLLYMSNPASDEDVVSMIKGQTVGHKITTPDTEIEILAVYEPLKPE